MPGQTRLGDSNTGHDLCAPSTLAEASPDVFVNGKGAGRVGDKYASHSCKDHPSHQDSISSGSATVFINGKAAARAGDSVVLGGSVQGASGNVITGG